MLSRYLIVLFLALALIVNTTPKSLAQQSPSPPLPKAPLHLSQEKIELDIEQSNSQPCIKCTAQKSRWQKFKLFLKGEKAHDQIIAGMWSKHFSNNKRYREDNNIFGIQYNGFWVSTFANSHNKQVITAGIARTVMKKQLSENWLFDVGYKVGPMYGYKDGAPDIAKFSILPFICVGLSYKNVGISLNIIPANAIAFYSYINMDMFRKKDTSL